MFVSDILYAEKKLAQVGYYRLSGFWHTARKQMGNGCLSDNFLPSTSFEEIYKLYIFDKKLRILLLDIIERLEIHIRGVIAHEIGREDPLAYEKVEFINPNMLDDFLEWQKSITIKITRSKDEFVKHHLDKKQTLPFWVIIELWDFGNLSKYYSMLKPEYQNMVCKRFNIDNHTLSHWLRQINFLRNCVAHHCRVWNRLFTAEMTIPSVNNKKFKRYKKARSYFSKLGITTEDKYRLFSRIAVMWYLINQTSTNYIWLEKVNEILASFPNVPNAKLKAMGLGDYEKLPIHLLRNI
ncbi:Abi family protein [Bisgaardia hudsonensis]|nr:Abi family protein [Bisgaardia hudsonensis]